MAPGGPTLCQSSVVAAHQSLLHRISEDGEDIHLLNSYDLEGQPDQDRSPNGTVWEEVRAKPMNASLASRLVPWSCAHLQCDVRPWSKRTMFCHAVRRPFWVLVVILGVASLASFAWNSILAVLADSRDAGIFPGQRPSLFSDWLTHGVLPIACHSHNDYWRRVPLFSALAAGCTSVEADIWLEGDELRVGHTMRTVLPNQSLRSLYLNPLLEVLDRHNPARNSTTIGAQSQSEPDSGRERDDTSPVGIFVTEPTQTLVLLIDFKSDPDLLWPLLIKHLQPLREKGYLTHFNGTTLIQRPITIVATGNAPFHRIASSYTYRDIFYDAPLDKLTLTPSPSDPDSTSPSVSYSPMPEYTKYNSFYASVNFHASIGPLPFSRLSQGQLAKVRAQIAAAHDRGLKVRYWGTPGWPVGLRNHVWKVLVTEGADVLNL
ncbi:uncharacterized protein N7482_009278 [Penicillium canariense]|uniref:Altered inheritance of mitochondria protein 6 n=1 Tax=Penicillium canariense TaxID=189055 RepID=A0A9W9HQI9_9EURO|nr:uncharacterized protein N7482_009278 [Penicillium canariense]KAJ5152800.1 hypothetical protein N7482_009278 [Penicillium canariense]